MGHGSIKTLGSIINEVTPGDVIYMLNSQEPLVVMFVTPDVVILNTAEICNKYRIIRYCGEWVREFAVNWDGLVEAEDYTINCEPFEENDYEEGLVVIYFSPVRYTASVIILEEIDKENKRWLTDEGTYIPFSDGDRIISTGVKYTVDVGVNDEDEEVER